MEGEGVRWGGGEREGGAGGGEGARKKRWVGWCNKSPLYRVLCLPDIFFGGRVKLKNG